VSVRKGATRLLGNDWYSFANGALLQASETGDGSFWGSTPQRSGRVRGRSGAADGVARTLEDPMSKAKSSHVKTRTSRQAEAPKRANTSRPHLIAPSASSRGHSKQARVLKLLRAPSGTTIDAMMKVTGWQSRSVRGFLAGVVRKKLGINLLSAAGDNGRIYRVKSEGHSKTAAST
jgi:hypothetical protein